MKYAAFALLMIFAVPLMTFLAWRSEKLRGYLFSALIFATGLGDHGNMHLLSIETYRGPDRGIEVALADLIAWSLAMAVIARKPGRISWIPYNTGLMVLYFGVAVLSIIDAPQGLLASFTIWKMLRGFVLYWTVVNVLRVGVPVRSVWRGILAIGIVFALYAVYQKYGLGQYRISATFDHSNTVPLFLNQVLPILLAMGLASRRLSTSASLVSLGVVMAMLLTVVMTFSRAGMVLSLFSILGVLLVANRKTKSLRVTVASLVVVGALGLGGLITGRSIVERFLEAPESSHMAREEFNRAARAMATDNPLGVGVNQFSYVLTNTPKYSDMIRIMAAEKQKGVCHEVYFLTAAEMGWIGLVVFAMVLLRFLWHASLEAFRRKGFDGLVQASIALGMLALHLSGFLEWVFRITPIFYLFLFCAGLSVGLAEVSRVAAVAARKARRTIDVPPDGTNGTDDGGPPTAPGGPPTAPGTSGRRPQVTGEWVPIRDEPPVWVREGGLT
jgi:hypothetical protein